MVPGGEDELLKFCRMVGHVLLLEIRKVLLLAKEEAEHKMRTTSRCFLGGMW